jgi:hypothetical protein
MKRTLLAIGFAVLVSMMLAPHRLYDGHVDAGVAYMPFFMQAKYERTSYSWRTGRLAIDRLAVQTVFLATLFGVLANIRWRRKV